MLRVTLHLINTHTPTAQEISGLVIAAVRGAGFT